MENYSLQLKKQVEQIDKMIQEADSRIQSNTGAGNKKICVTNRKNGYQYYEIDKDGNRTYISKNNIAMVKSIAQHDYDLAVLKTLIDTRHRIMRFLKKYDIDSIENVYNNLCEGRKALVNPIIQTDKDYVQEWKKIYSRYKNSYPMVKTYQTELGEQVRSKSEKILADIFLKHKIPYIYEPQVVLKDGKTLYPDFALLNLRTRRTIFWEHFGLVSNGEYATKAFYKLREYEENGLVVGDNLLYSLESEAQPFNQKKIEEKIRQYLM